MSLKKSLTNLLSVKQLVILTLLLMMVGTITELFLLHHYEGLLQLIPILCIGISLGLVVALSFQKNAFLMNAFMTMMGLSAFSGVYGTFLHMKANFEFEQEMKPTATFFDLMMESLTGALPALAPASMIVFALIGTIYLKLLKQNQ